jgi:hypothetical protein
LNNLIATAMLPSGGAFQSAGSQAASVLGSLGPTLLGQVQQAAKTQAATNTLVNMLNQAGGAQGPEMGLLSRIGQTFTGGPAGLLPGQNQLGQLQAQVSGATGAPAPSIMSNQQTAQNALQGVQALINSMYGANSGLTPGVS